ncbi:hypothetical protein PTNB73_05870 [Pyrenophora teres f. teres]|nr:hypothetical protein PTNB85_08188 [Pyrenophora teres f. teres]KAE8841498.1 hypothetical protein HRS9122_05624 [Pyrenophora teres f. teres]KAE8864982.1 hypothetical protein PTNB73_05870 [Pyrenophora teres f. teres]
MLREHREDGEIRATGTQTPNQISKNSKSRRKQTMLKEGPAHEVADQGAGDFTMPPPWSWCLHLYSKLRIEAGGGAVGEDEVQDQGLAQTVSHSAWQLVAVSLADS